MVGGGFGAAKDGEKERITDEADSNGITNTAPEIELEEEEAIRLGKDEPISIPSECPHCNAMGESLTAQTTIPHFKEIIIMAFDCKECGFKDSEVKAGGAVPDKGMERK